MALRKFSKYMKVMTVLIILSVVLSSAYAGYSYITSYMSTRKHVMMTINGIKIYKEDYEKEYGELVSNLEKLYIQQKTEDKEDYIKVPDRIIKEATLSYLITESLFRVLAKDMKIEVSSAEINEKLSDIENQYGGKETVALLLAQQNLTISDLKEDIKASLTYYKVLEKLKETYKPTEAELEKLYSIFKYSDFESRAYDEVKDEVLESYYSKTLNFVLSSKYEEIFENLTINTKEEEIKELFESIKKVEIQVEDIKVYRKNILALYIGEAVQNANGYDETVETKVNEKQKVELERLLSKEKEITSLGIKALDGLSPANRIQDLQQRYYYYIVDSYKPTEADMQEWFRIKKDQYDVKNTVSGEIIGMNYNTSELSKKDIELSEKKAKEIMKTITKDNFEAKAKELSKDPGSAQDGGNLSWVDLRSLVSEFSVVKKAEKDSIIGPVKTKFGYHIIYVVDKDENDINRYNLKHILLGFEISDETKNSIKEQVLTLEKEIRESKITWEQIASDSTGKYAKFDIKEQFSKVPKNSSLPKFGYDENTMKKLFEIKVGDFLQKDLGDAFVIIQKTQEIPYKAATFEEFKERVRLELAFIYATQKIQN